MVEHMECPPAFLGKLVPEHFSFFYSVRDTPGWGPQFPSLCQSFVTEHPLGCHQVRGLCQLTQAPCGVLTGGAQEGLPVMWPGGAHVVGDGLSHAEVPAPLGTVAARVNIELIVKGG